MFLRYLIQLKLKFVQTMFPCPFMWSQFRDNAVILQSRVSLLSAKSYLVFLVAIVTGIKFSLKAFTVIVMSSVTVISFLPPIASIAESV